MNDEHDEGGEYTRFKAKIQLGDGPDQRGEVTVETVRERGEDDIGTLEKVELPEEVEGHNITSARINHEDFGEFYFELARARAALAEQLGLEDT